MNKLQSRTFNGLLPLATVAAALALAGCGTTQPASSASKVQPVAQSTGHLRTVSPAPNRAAAPQTRESWRYQCATEQGAVEGLLVTYHGGSPLGAEAVSLQRGAQSYALSRNPLAVNTVFLANDESHGYRWQVADNGVGTLRVRAPLRTAVETEVLTACQPIDNPQG